jgi:hypothetical protein
MIETVRKGYWNAAGNPRFLEYVAEQAVEAGVPVRREPRLMSALGGSRRARRVVRLAHAAPGCAMRAPFIVALLAVAGCDSATQVSDSGFGAYEVSLAAWQDELAVAWYDTRDGNAEVYVRMLDAAGNELGAESRLTSTTEESFEADIVATANGFVVAWYEGTAGGALRAKLGSWDRERRERWTLTLGVPEGESRSPVVRVAGDALMCAWLEKDGDEIFLWAGWWGLDGTPLAAPARVAAASADTWNLNGAVDGEGRAFVVFEARAETKAQELYLAEIGRDTPTRVTRLSDDDGFNSLYPDIAFSPTGQVAVAWFDERDGNQEVYLASGSMEELRTRFGERERRITVTEGHSIGAYLAWNEERIGLAWSDDTSGSFEIYYRPFDASGDALGAQRRLTNNLTDSLIPAIRAWRTGFALAWSEVNAPVAAVHDPATRSEVMFSLVD